MLAAAPPGRSRIMITVSDLFCVYRGREHDVAVLRPAGAVGASSRSHANAAGCRARGPGTPPHGHQPPR